MSVAVLLRRTEETDIHRLVAAEAEAETRQWLGEVSLDWHRRAIAQPDTEHLSIVASGALAGFVLLAGIGATDRIVELRRIVTFGETRGRGIGTAAIQAVIARVFDMHAAHRLWLDVKSTNRWARAVYSGVGFVPEGELRDAWREPDGSYTSLVVMAMLTGDRLPWRG